MAGNTLRIGNVEITAFTDAAGSAPCSMSFPEIGTEDWKPFKEHLAGDHIPLIFQSYFVRSDGKTVVIDTGIGDKDRPYFPAGRLPQAMACAGIRPEDVDIVVATHIHVDHVGWHTIERNGAFEPFFPNARHVFARAEFEYFTGDDQVNRAENAHVRDCVVPLIDRADIQLVDSEHALTDELTLLPAPGHTPAHSAVAIMSGGEAGVIIGDVCHHPAQVTENGWATAWDVNPALAWQTRETLMARIEEERLTMIAGHFPAPGFGRVVRVDGRRTWRAL